jgi:zinc transport system ATP-binding protein
MSTLIAAENVWVTRADHHILHDVLLAVGERDFITVVGPNGAGKSMLLNCLMGFFAPDKGRVVRAPSLRIGYVPQRFVPDHTMPISVRRFISLHKKAPAFAVEKVAQEASVDTILDKPLHVLSGGELQRVLLARALLSDPQLLVLDEPAQNLDISGQLAFYKLLERIFAERTISILMVSHDLHMVMASTKKVVCLFHHICCSGEPHAVTKDPEFIALFGGDMARMMAVYQHSHTHQHDHEQHAEHVHSQECQHA